MYSFIFRFTLGIFALVGVLRTARVLKEPKETRDKGMVSFFMFFLALALHQFAWSVPFTIFESAMPAFYLYELGIIFYFGLLYFSLGSLAYIFPDNLYIRHNHLGKLISLAGVVVVLLGFYDFGGVAIENDFVIWKEGIAASWISALAGFGVASIWVMMFCKYFPKTNRTSAVLFTIAVAMLGTSCLVFFPLKTPFASIKTFLLIAVGLVFNIISFTLPKKTA